jgi:hypothetical protein
MSDIIPTIKVKPWGDGQGDFVEINESDFDPKVHNLYEVEVDDGEATAEEIVAAITALDPKDDGHWTKGGLPDVNVLAKAIGKRLTRAAVDDAAPDAKRPTNG